MLLPHLITWEPGRDFRKENPWVVRDHADHVLLSAPTLEKAIASAPEAKVSRSTITRYAQHIVAVSKERMLEDEEDK